MVIEPLLVVTTAVYRLAGSMTIGGGPSNRWVLGLEPSTAGISGAMALLLQVGGSDLVRPGRGWTATPAAGPRGQDSVIFTEIMRWSVTGVPVLLLAAESPALIWSTRFIPEITVPKR